MAVLCNYKPSPSLPYHPGNTTDLRKINLLNLMLEYLPMNDCFQYFGMHEGEGAYTLPDGRIWKGTAITVLENRLECDKSNFFINEIDDARREKLSKNLIPYCEMAKTFEGNIRLGKDWTDNIEHCIHYFEPTGNSLFVSDPSTMEQHVSVVGWMPYIIGEGYDKRNLFMYVPEGIGDKFKNETFETGSTGGGRIIWTHQTIMAQTLKNFGDLGRSYLDIQFDAGSKGEERIDHYVISAHPVILNAISKERERRLINNLREMEREDN